MDSNRLIIAGFMSGTSMDGLDCCIAEINIDADWKFQYNIIASQSFAFNQNIKSKIKEYIGCTKLSEARELDDFMGRVYLDLSKDFLLDYSLDAIAIHGQTIHHSDKIRSLQVGKPCYLASFFNVPIIYNFRQKDILLNGNGAPLMPFLDWLLFKDKEYSTMTVNLGGIANISFIPMQGVRGDVIGFDAGPGMALIDEYVLKVWKDDCDYNGKYSYDANVDENMLSYLINNTGFISQPPPKSTGREDFGVVFISEVINKFNYLNKSDILRTLIKFTSVSLKLNIKNFINSKYNVDRLMISGGGAKHPILMNDIKKDLDIPTLNIIDYNMRYEIKESFLMAVLGYAKMKGMASNMPSVTGASGNIALGDIYVA